MARRTFKLDPQQHLSDPNVPRAGPYRWPLPVLARLRAIVTEVNRLGARTNQAEVLAAIVCGPPPDAAELKSRVEAYRVATVGGIMNAPDANDVVRVEARGAGRPSGS
jgi:hypothetical protein